MAYSKIAVGVDFSKEFYERIRAHPDASAILRSDNQVRRLQATLVRWMDRLLAGPWDQEYYEARLRIGRVHVQIKLPQHYMFTAMGVLQGRLHSIALDHEAPRSAIRAVDKITHVDLAIMLESYRDDFVAAIRTFERAQQDDLARQLAASEARHLAVFEGAAAAVLAIDREGRIVLFNRYLEEATDLQRSAVLGTTCEESLCHPNDSERMHEYTRRAFRAEAVDPFELRVITANRQQKWFRWQLTMIQSGSEPVVCAIGIEVTQQYELAARTRRAETLASLGTLAAGLAHEIRNPLNAAQLQLMLVDRSVRKLGDAAPQKALDSAQMVRDELGRLAGLVEDFLAYARPRTLRVENVDVCSVIDGVLALLAPDARHAQVELIGHPGDAVVARLDEERLKQVLFNLIRNAIEAAADDSEEGVVEIRCYRVAQSVLIEVIDNGKKGLPQDVDIFEPFATSKDAGTGLGLPIVHRIVADHGGEVHNSRRDGHTYFVVEFPVDGPPVELMP